MAYTATIVPIPVTRVKAGVHGSLPKVPQMPLVRAEYESTSKAKPECESYGLQSCKLANYALVMGEYDQAAKLMVQEHLDLKLGVTRLTPVISFTLLPIEQAPSKPMYGCDRYAPALLGTAMRTYNSINNNPVAARLECDTWKASRIPQQGQRPSKLLSRSK